MNERVVDPHATRQERLAEARETLEWCKDWRDGQFAPAHTPDGWTVEMYGLVDSAERHAEDVLALAAELVAVTERERAAVERDDWLRKQLDLLIEDAEVVASVVGLALARSVVGNLKDARAALAAHGDTPEPGVMVHEADCECESCAEFDAAAGAPVATEEP